MLGSPISYQLPPRDINFLILLNFGNLPDFYDSVMEQELFESLPLTKLDWDCNNCEHSSISIDEFLQKLKVAHTEIQFIEKNTRKQREAKEFQEHRKNRLTSIPAHKNFTGKKALMCYEKIR